MWKPCWTSHDPLVYIMLLYISLSYTIIIIFIIIIIIFIIILIIFIIIIIIFIIIIIIIIIIFIIIIIIFIIIIVVVICLKLLLYSSWSYLFFLFLSKTLEASCNFITFFCSSKMEDFEDTLFKFLKN